MDVHGIDLKGKFWPQRISSIIDDPWQADYESRIVYDESDQALYFATDAEWVKITAVGDLFNIGQKVIFVSSLPAGWNIDISLDDKIILVTNDEDEIGEVGGQWAITGMVTAGSHDHFTPEQMSGPTITALAGASEIYTLAGTSSHKHDINFGGEHIHTFQGIWRPPYALLAVGVYEG